ncbi:MAG: 1-acyl-sn-glycerol-3-phosphate acyltransferase [Alphaproteobacteria bacterium]|nr:1-acyl-sn-glycerol-3-phosphate acyltransferase [Alphaproteobacteria bacterium]
MNSTFASLKLFGFALLCALVVPFQALLLLAYKGRGTYILPHLWHKAVCAVFGIRIQMQGKAYTDSQVIYVSNHLSYLDIPALASMICYGSFVAKKDVASWPVFGYLSKLQQTAFVSRSREDARKGANALATMLKDGKNMIIFPEGTSTDGREVVPFKSSLFSIALQEEAKDLVIQPVSIEVLSANGRAPQTQEERDLYAWHRDMDTELPEHLWRFAKTSGAVLKITFHDIVRANDFSDRKTLAKACYETVSKGLELSKAA